MSVIQRRVVCITYEFSDSPKLFLKPILSENWDMGNKAVKEKLNVSKENKTLKKWYDSV